MESIQEPYGLNDGDSVPDSDLSCLTPYEFYQIEQFSKILQFEDSVRTGTHPRISPQPDSKANITTLEVPMNTNGEAVATTVKEAKNKVIDTANYLDTIVPTQSRKEGPRNRNTNKNGAQIMMESKDSPDRINRLSTATSNSKLMFQAFSISGLKLKDKINGNIALVSVAEIQCKLLEAGEVQAQSAVGEKMTQVRDHNSAKGLRSQNESFQDYINSKILRDQKPVQRRRLDAQRAAAKRAATQRVAAKATLGLSKIPPTGPRISMGMAPRMMKLARNRSISASPLSLRPQQGLTMGYPPVLEGNPNKAGPVLDSSESRQQSPTEKRQRFGEKEGGSKKEVRGNTQNGKPKGPGQMLLSNKEDEKSVGGNGRKRGRGFGKNSRARRVMSRKSARSRGKNAKDKPQGEIRSPYIRFRVGEVF